MKIRFHNSKLMVLIESAFIMAWLSNLAGTDAIFCVYVLCGIAGIYTLYDNYRNDSRFHSRFELGVITLFGALFSVVVALANYRIFSPVSDLLVVFNLFCSLLGGFAVGFHILLAAVRRIPENVSENRTSGKDAVKYFFTSFFVSLIKFTFI